VIVITCLHLIRVVGVQGQGIRVVAIWPVRGVTLKTREDPAEEVAENNLPTKGEYEWVAANVRTQYSLFRWSRILNAWLNCVPVLERGTRPNIVSLERVSVVECVCHAKRGPRKDSFICTCVISPSCICGFHSMTSRWGYFAY